MQIVSQLQKGSETNKKVDARDQTEACLKAAMENMKHWVITRPNADNTGTEKHMDFTSILTMPKSLADKANRHLQQRGLQDTINVYGRQGIITRKFVDKLKEAFEIWCAALIKFMKADGEVKAEHIEMLLQTSGSDATAGAKSTQTIPRKRKRNPWGPRHEE